MKKPLRKQTQATVKQLTNLFAFSMSLKHLHVLQFLTSQKLLLWPNLTHSLKKEQKEKWGWEMDVLLKTICLLSRWPKRRNRFTMLRSTEQNINVSLSCRARYRSRTGSHGEVKWIRRSCRLFNYCWVESQRLQKAVVKAVCINTEERIEEVSLFTVACLMKSVFNKNHCRFEGLFFAVFWS